MGSYYKNYWSCMFVFAMNAQTNMQCEKSMPALLFAWTTGGPIDCSGRLLKKKKKKMLSE